VLDWRSKGSICGKYVKAREQAIIAKKGFNFFSFENQIYSGVCFSVRYPLFVFS
jgi:hypothetical protein